MNRAISATSNVHAHRSPRRLLVLVGLILILALALPAMAKHRPVGGTVTAVDFDFVPSTVTIEQGTNVLLKNDGPNEPHTLSSFDFLFESGAVLPGGERVVNTERLAEGTYEFFCGFHPDIMLGTLIVEG